MERGEGGGVYERNYDFSFLVLPKVTFPVDGVGLCDNRANSARAGTWTELSNNKF